MVNETLINIEIAQDKINKKLDEIEKQFKYYSFFITDEFKPKFKQILISLASFAIILTVLNIFRYIKFIYYILSIIAVIGGAYFIWMIHIIKTHEDYIKILKDLEDQKKIAQKHQKDK